MTPDESLLTPRRRLRYELTLTMVQVRERTFRVPELIEVAEQRGALPAGRASKVVSDALRWEVARGRVVREGRGRYRAGWVARSTVWWMRACIEAHAVRGATVSSRGAPSAAVASTTA